MAGGRFDNLDDEQKALHESWDDVGRIVLLVGLTSVAIWALCAALKKAVHAVGDGLLAFVVERGPIVGPLVLLAALLVSGVLRGVLHKSAGFRDAANDGIDVALKNYHLTYKDNVDNPAPRYEKPAFLLALRKAFATLLTLGAGGSGGLEGPVVLVGESMGAGISRVMAARSEHELRTYQLAGIAAAVSTLLNAPFASALFAIEVVYGDRVIYRKLAYAMLAGTITYVLNTQLLGYKPVFEAPTHSHLYTLPEYAVSAIVAVAVSAPIALLFGLTMKHTRAVAERVEPIRRGLLGALGTAVVALGLYWALDLDVRHTLGMGDYTLRLLLQGSDTPQELTAWWLLVVAALGRILTTGFTVQSGGSAGMLIPSMFLGGVAGAATGRLLQSQGLFPNTDIALFVVVGVACSLVAMVGVPMAAIALVFEVFGAEYGPPAILACGVTYVLTLRLSVYGEQRRSPDPTADEIGYREAAARGDPPDEREAAPDEREPPPTGGR